MDLAFRLDLCEFFRVMQERHEAVCMAPRTANACLGELPVLSSTPLRCREGALQVLATSRSCRHLARVDHGRPLTFQAC